MDLSEMITMDFKFLNKGFMDNYNLQPMNNLPSTAYDIRPTWFSELMKIEDNIVTFAIDLNKIVICFERSSCWDKIINNVNYDIGCKSTLKIISSVNWNVTSGN